MNTLKVFILALIVILSVHSIVTKISNKNKIHAMNAKLTEEYLGEGFMREEIEMEVGLENVIHSHNNNEYLLLSTIEGNIHAYCIKNLKELWNISLGKPLVISNINSKNIFYEKRAIIPGLDGSLYIYSNENVDYQDSDLNKKGILLKKLDIPLKTFIDQTPFSYKIPNHIFLGEKKSSMFTIDINRGFIISKYSDDEEVIFQNPPVQANNLLTIIRIDYTLICLNQLTNSQSWNITVSEVMAIHKGSRSEIELNAENIQNNSKLINQISNKLRIQTKLQQLMEISPHMNSIVSIHQYNNYENNLPVKVYDVKLESGNTDSQLNFIQYFNERFNNFQESDSVSKINNYNTNETSKEELNYDFYQILSDYLKWTKEKVRDQNSFSNRNSLVTLAVFKFWEMYYFEHYFFIYITIIFLLLLIVVILIIIILKNIRKHQLLKQKIRKLSDERKQYNYTEIYKKYNNIPKEKWRLMFQKKLNFDYKEENLRENKTEVLALYKDLQFLSYKSNQSNYKLQKMEKSKQEIKKNEETNNLQKKTDSPIFSLMILGQGENSNMKTNLDLMSPGINTNLFQNRVVELGLQNHSREINSTTETKVYQDIEGIYIHEENHKIVTKFENNEIVESTMKKFEKIVSNIRTGINNNDSDKRKNRKYSQDIGECNNQKIGLENFITRDLALVDNYKFSSKLIKNQTKIDGEINNEGSKKKRFEIKFSIIGKKTNNGTKILIDHHIKKKEIDKNINLESNSIKLDKKKDDNKSQKRKYNYKEFSLFNKEKINTTHIDEDRLEKTFDDIQKIGQGGFGCVFKAKHKIDRSYYAIKMIELNVNISKNLMDHEVIKEVKTMMKLNHKNVVRYTTCWFQLKIENIINIIDMSRMLSEPNTISKSLSQYYYSSKNDNKRRNQLKENNKNLYSNIISENEEKSSYKSRNGFNWDESIKKEDSVVFCKENSVSNTSSNDIFIRPKIDKAFSLSIEEQKMMNESNEIINMNNDSKSKIYGKHSTKTYESCSHIKKRHSNREARYKVYFFMQMEYCDGLPLNQFLEFNKDKGLDRKLIFTFFKQIVTAVNHIHKNNVIHRDLKPHNIFIFGKDSIKIGDFGLATDLNRKERSKNGNLIQFNSGNSSNYYDNNKMNTTNNYESSQSVKLSECVGTPLYQSPEQKEGLHYNEKVDIFALGLILYELCSSFKTQMERRESIDKLKNFHKINENIQTDFSLESVLILSMTNNKPSERPSAQEIIDSPLFNIWKGQFDCKINLMCTERINSI